jgi:hypothetical protein
MAMLGTVATVRTKNEFTSRAARSSKPAMPAGRLNNQRKSTAEWSNYIVHRDLFAGIASGTSTTRQSTSTYVEREERGGDLRRTCIVTITLCHPKPSAVSCNVGINLGEFCIACRSGTLHEKLGLRTLAGFRIIGTPHCPGRSSVRANTLNHGNYHRANGTHSRSDSDPEAPPIRVDEVRKIHRRVHLLILSISIGNERGNAG